MENTYHGEMYDSIESRKRMQSSSWTCQIIRGFLFMLILNTSFTKDFCGEETMAITYFPKFEDIDVDNEVFPPLVNEEDWGHIYSSRVWCYLPMNLPNRTQELYDVLVTWGRYCETVLVALTEHDFYNPKNFSGFKNMKVVRMGLPTVENLSGLSGNIFSLSRISQLHVN